MKVLAAPFPSLDDSKWVRLVALALLYAGQGLPIGIFQVALPAYMASLGMSPAEVGGFIAFVFIPWSFKLIAGPVMDKFVFPAMGRRRPWILLAQSGLLLSFVTLCLLGPDPASQYWLLAALGFLSNFFGALQDVAVDGMAIDLLREDERAQGNAFMYGGQMSGISVAGSISSWALMSFGLQLAAALMAICVFLILLIPLFLRERPGERILPWTEGVPATTGIPLSSDSWFSILSCVFQALLLPMSMLLILIEALNRMTSGLLVAMSPVLTVQDLGWQQLDFSNWVAITGVIAALAGVVLGPIIDRLGSLRILKWVVIFRLVIFLVMALFENMWGVFSLFESFMLLNAIATQIVTITLIALFMRLCLHRVAASQFAVYMALANLTYSMGSGLLVLLSGFTDYRGMMLFSSLMIGLMLLLLPFVDLDRHERDLSKLP